jgi:membrane protein YqaA with SNARE-associated domain
MINDQEKKDNYFGDDLLDDAKMAAPVAKAIMERINGNNNRIDRKNRENDEVANRIKMRKLNKVFAILALIAIIGEIFAFIYGKMVLPNDLIIIAVIICGFVYTKMKSTEK